MERSTCVSALVFRVCLKIELFVLCEPVQRIAWLRAVSSSIDPATASNIGEGLQRSADTDQQIRLPAFRRQLVVHDDKLDYILQAFQRSNNVGAMSPGTTKVDIENLAAALEQMWKREKTRAFR